MMVVIVAMVMPVVVAIGMFTLVLCVFPMSTSSSGCRVPLLRFFQNLRVSIAR